jgi:hypothetical protein
LVPVAEDLFEVVEEIGRALFVLQEKNGWKRFDAEGGGPRKRFRRSRKPFQVKTRFPPGGEAFGQPADAGGGCKSC